jgi:hypothetical protein
MRAPGRVNLLVMLTDRFTVLGELPAGGESDVLVVADGAGVRWVVKQYRRPGWAPSADVLDVFDDLRIGKNAGSWAADPVLRHLVFLSEWGTDPSTGLFFEVQEYLPGGTLTDAAAGSWDARVAADAVIDAVAAFHRSVGAHRDLKPDNLLVRSADPLVLTVADVGLARDVGEGSQRFSHRDGSAAYQAPEAAQGKVSRAGDWWAVGIIVAEAAAGRHPLARPDGTLPDNRVLLAEVAEHDIPLDAVCDDRLRLLCQGLLTRDTAQRWRMGQITAWRNGDNPPTGYTAQAAGASGDGLAGQGPPVRTRTVLFAGTDYGTAQALAAALAADPQRAGEALFANRDAILLEDLRMMLRQAGLHDAAGVLDSYRSGPWEPAYLRLLSEMDPALEPRLAGQDMTPAGIGQTAADVIARGGATPDEQAALTWIVHHDLWRLWRALPGMTDALACATRLREIDPDGKPVWEALTRGLIEARQESDQDMGDTTWLAAAWTVALSTDPQAANTALNTLLNNAAETLPDQRWWLTLTRGPALSRCLAAATLGWAKTGQAEAAIQQRRWCDDALVRHQSNRERLTEAALEAHDRQRARSEALPLPGKWPGGARREAQARILGDLRQARMQLQPFLTASQGSDLVDASAFAKASDKDAFIRRALSWRPQRGDLRPAPKPTVWDEVIAVSASLDGLVCVWNPLTGARIGARLTVGRGTANVMSVAVGTTPAGRMVAVASSGDTVRVWDPLKGEILGEPLTGHTDIVTSVALGNAPDGRLVAVFGSDDRTVRVWDQLANAAIGAPLTGGTDTVTSVAMGNAPGGRLVAISASLDGTVRVWDPLKDIPIGQPFRAHTRPVQSVALGASTGNSLVAASVGDDHLVRFWDPLTGTKLKGRQIGRGRWRPFIALGSSRDQPLIAAATSDDNTVRVWDPLAATAIVRSVTGHAAPVTSLAFGVARWRWA